jgi:crotonobetainyl-CoA:carnitine CoA-transferase CaiB-like acyl-CoA transferase
MLHVFSGMRVADFTSGMAGPMAAMVLADNGAHVVRASQTPKSLPKPSAPPALRLSM